MKNHIFFYAVRFSKLIFVISGSVVAVVMIGAVSLLHQNSEVQPMPSRSPTTDSTSQLTPGVPDDWQTYRNEDFGFELKYPNDWIVLENDSSGRGFFQEDADLSLGFRRAWIDPANPSYADIHIFAEKIENEIDQPIVSELGERHIWRLTDGEKITIDGVDGYRFDYRTMNFDAPVEISFLERESILYGFNCISFDFEGNVRDIIRNACYGIVQSFKFRNY